MEKIFFLPVSLVSGLLARLISKKLFALIWGAVDDQRVPKPEYRQVNRGKLVAALVVEGAVFALIRGLVDHGARHSYARLTGSWPGDEQPKPK
jgi:Protein of unknown function (DUF4235)